MNKHDLTPQDYDLIKAAVEAVQKPALQLFGEKKPSRVAAAVRLDDGQIITSLNLLADVGGLSTCAEPVAIAQAVRQFERKIVAIVSVYGAEGAAPVVVSPCGRCREAINDYGPECYIILRQPRTNNHFKVLVKDMLPLPYADFWDGDTLL